MRVFPFLFTSCNQDDDPVPPEAGSKTVLVYIVADKNGLESSYPSNFATQDIDEMLVGMKSIDTSLYNLLIYLDDNGDSPILFRIAKDKKGNVERQIVKKYAEQVSTDVDVMKEVMHRTFMNIQQIAMDWFIGRMPMVGFLILYLQRLLVGLDKMLVRDRITV